MLNDASRVEFVVEELQNSVTKVLKWDAVDFQRKVDEIERLKKDPDRKSLANYESGLVWLNLSVSSQKFLVTFLSFKTLSKVPSSSMMPSCVYIKILSTITCGVS